MRLRGRVGALATGALVIEDFALSRADEPALFHLLNLAREQGAFLLITARERLDQGPFMLADVASRLRAVLAGTLAPPDDRLLAAVLVKLFADRQLAIDEGVVSYLVARIERYRTVTKWDAGGPTIRLHIGLEDPDDLIADLERGFAALSKA